LLSEACRVVEVGELGGPGGAQWSWTLARRTLVYSAEPGTPTRDRDLFPDTIVEDELVLFTGAGRDRVRPVWHDRSDARFELLRPPSAAPLGDVVLLAHRRCLNGTGGCLDHPFRLTSDGTVAALVPAYRSRLRRRAPAPWSFSKGSWIDVVRGVVEAPVYVPGDANCCPSFLATASLRLEYDTLTADSVRLEPVPSAGTWLVLPGERFGPIDARTTEEDLARHFGASMVLPAEVYLAEGFCSPGVRVLPETPHEVELAWSDSAHTRPAFARVRDLEGAWHTPKGVRVGSALAELQSLAGKPVTFSGFGWDYGGGTGWEEHRGMLGLRLGPDSASDRLLAALAQSDPRATELLGDRPVRSAHPIVTRLRILVEEMILSWAPVVEERECG
jgi:hypothetical protein